MARKPAKKTLSKAKVVQDKAPAFVGWSTTDDEEITRRHWRGLTDIAKVEALEPEFPYFGTYQVHSTSGSSYVVEIRSLLHRDNSCGCPDWQINGLGTCKHVEGVVDWLRRKGKKAFAAASRAGSGRLEIFPSSDGGPAIRILRPSGGAGCDALVDPLVDDKDRLAGDPVAALEALRAAMKNAPQASIRFSRHLDARLYEERRRRRRMTERQAFLDEVEAGRASFDIVRHPLLPYQREGMLHLAFGERALLADEMGLGKTVQAIAACELLRRRKGIRRVLVVLPASLKAEWEDQIGRFINLPVAIISGLRPDRLRQYQTDAFFVLVNYEQVLIDRDDINRLVAPDVVVLDEAQRIKNWHTKTANAVKGLKSAYAFVLTGTPLENRIDEVYSIVQYLDPKLLGPLFRFNRDFYVLDDRGRPENYKNLDELHRRLKPIMLRRRKDAVEDQLPTRTVDTYFVTMTEEQQLRYADFEAPACRLIAQAQRRSLTQQEFDRLQQLLACMRMVCDTPYILDPNCRVSPKLDELETILADLLAEPGRKVIIFSEWERMLELVRDLVGEMGLDFAWHTGAVPQDRRRLEIRRFKNDPACRVFLSTDSGSVGLNLQVASAVINMDLPWNPAKLEQRIARAWRKHQTKPVTVVNLVCENSIEHRILHLLAQKQGLADGVLDGRGDVAEIKMPSGRAAFLDRLAAILPPPQPAAPVPASADTVDALIRDWVDRLGDRLLLVERLPQQDGASAILVVLEGTPAEIMDQRDPLAEQATPTGVAVEVIDRATWETLRRLRASGLVRLAETTETLYGSAHLDKQDRTAKDMERHLQRQRAVAEALAQAERKLRMAALLADGDFGDEAMAPMTDAAAFGLRALAVATEDDLDAEAIGIMPVAELLQRDRIAARLPPGAVAALTGAGSIDKLRTAVQSLLAAAQQGKTNQVSAETSA